MLSKYLPTSGRKYSFRYAWKANMWQTHMPPSTFVCISPLKEAFCPTFNYAPILFMFFTFTDCQNFALYHTNFKRNHQQI